MPALTGTDGRNLITVDADEHLPAVIADPGPFEGVIANVVDDALRHGVLDPP